MANKTRWRTRISIVGRELRSPLVSASASDSKSRSPGVPSGEIFTFLTMGRVGRTSIVASSLSDVLARIINVNYEIVDSQVLRVLFIQSEERTYCLRAVVIFVQGVVTDSCTVTNGGVPSLAALDTCFLPSPSTCRFLRSSRNLADPLNSQRLWGSLPTPL
jgi:hypothetical protein